MTKFTETTQWKSGDNAAQYMDVWLRARGWIVRPTTPHEERTLCLGDRLIQSGTRRYWIEYKSGLQTAYTGNVFLETISVDTQNKPGWIYTCKADYLLYAILPIHKILIFEPAALRGRIEGLRAHFREVKTSKGQNATYCTHGLIVPLDYVEKHLANRVIIVKGGNQ